MTKSTEVKISPHNEEWISKTLAAAILGFTLSLALSGIFAYAGPGGLQAANKTQFNMWLMAPIWALCLSFVYFFKNGMRAWLWLGLANVVGFAILAICRS